MLNAAPDKKLTLMSNSSTSDVVSTKEDLDDIPPLLTSTST